MNDINREAPSVTEVLRDSDTRANWQSRLTTHRRWLVIVAVLLAFALLAWLLTPKATRPPAGRFAGGGPMPVVAAAAHTGDMPITLIGLGAVTPLATVTVQSQISGQIMHIYFKEGDEVKAAASLIQIDPRPYQAALDQAVGTLAKDEANLKNMQAEAERYTALYEALKDKKERETKP